MSEGNIEDIEDLGVLEQEEETLEIDKTPVKVVKKQRSEAQIKAFENCRLKRDYNRKSRMDKRNEDENLRKTVVKKKTDEKIVKKALQIKKKEIVSQAILDDSSDSDSDIDIEIVKKIIKKKQEKKKKKGGNEKEKKEVEVSKPTYFFK